MRSVVQVYLGPPVLYKACGLPRRSPFSKRGGRSRGELAQLGERLLCKQEVTGSIPVFSTSCSRGKPSCQCEALNAPPPVRAGARSSLTTEYLAHLAEVVLRDGGEGIRCYTLRSAAKTENLLLANSMVKLIRAYGGCLGAERR